MHRMLFPHFLDVFRIGGMSSHFVVLVASSQPVYFHLQNQISVLLHHLKELYYSDYLLLLSVCDRWVRCDGGCPHSRCVQHLHAPAESQATSTSQTKTQAQTHWEESRTGCETKGRSRFTKHHHGCLAVAATRDIGSRVCASSIAGTR